MTNIITAEASLATLAASINRCIREAESAARTAVELAIEAGQQLNTAKEQVPHGQWESWLSENVEAAPRTAQAYMRLAREVPLLSAEEAQRVADLPLREAMKAIATQPSAPANPRMPNMRVRKLDDRDRIKRAFGDSATKIRKVARMAEYGARIKPKDIASARRALEQALAQLAELERDHLDVDRVEERP
ncbi:DUF3102 domain-containing protein [Azotobacter beijerinckii]|uniref:DUF3102 domain-containing protein n=1 Tax=Azotobacter beijerinckii TaxID=170623 RepID=UPI0029530EF7|nr:DUF3102 domain-containing protein [Azotobacter beijerinckii]MDV7210122.1 DUF3102 domain-containing protein [Azotobacter beijerinckii]